MIAVSFVCGLLGGLLVRVVSDWLNRPEPIYLQMIESGSAPLIAELAAGYSE